MFCTAHRWQPAEAPAYAATVPIGVPFEGTEAMVVDTNGRPAGAGELLLRGDQMFAGYLDPRNDEHAFTPEGFSERRWYRTGDLVARGPHGLTHLGRVDDHAGRLRRARPGRSPGTEPAGHGASGLHVPGAYRRHRRGTAQRQRQDRPDSLQGSSGGHAVTCAERHTESAPRRRLRLDRLGLPARCTRRIFGPPPARRSLRLSWSSRSAATARSSKAIRLLPYRASRPPGRP